MFNTLKPTTENKKRKLVGRGSKRGKTSGRGTKGQKARAGHKIRPMMRDIIKKLPKLRGRGKNINKAFRTTAVAINFSVINAQFPNGGRITPATLHAKGVLRREGGTFPKVKILAGGTLASKISVFDCEVSEAARAAIVALGGSAPKSSSKKVNDEQTA